MARYVLAVSFLIGLSMIFCVGAYYLRYEVGGNRMMISKTERLDEKNYLLKDGLLVISEDSNVVWKSPPDWQVADFALADPNEDGVTDMNLSVWKAGNFGASKPFWIERNDMSVKNHFFVLDLIGGAVKPIWQSSNLEAPNCEIAFADIDGDGKDELVVIEGDYAQEPTCGGNHLAIWKWNGWGFSNEWRSEKGDFSNLRIEKIGSKARIITD